MDTIGYVIIMLIITYMLLFICYIYINNMIKEEDQDKLSNKLIYIIYQHILFKLYFKTILQDEDNDKQFFIYRNKKVCYYRGSIYDIDKDHNINDKFSKIHKELIINKFKKFYHIKYGIK